MACRGVHFAIVSDVVEKLCSAQTDQDVLSIVTEDIEGRWDQDWLHETDKAWDAIHRCLTNGRLEFGSGFDALGAAVMGGIRLHKGDSWIVSLVTPDDVPKVAEALAEIDQAEMKHRYGMIDVRDYDGEIGDDDWEYTWSYFQGLEPLFRKAEESGRGIVFSVDQ